MDVTEAGGILEQQRETVFGVETTCGSPGDPNPRDSWGIGDSI